MFSTDVIFRQQANLVDNQKCQAGFRQLCNKILFIKVPPLNFRWIKRSKKIRVNVKYQVSRKLCTVYQNEKSKPEAKFTPKTKIWHNNQFSKMSGRFSFHIAPYIHNITKNMYSCVQNSIERLFWAGN